jgi:6-phosphofructokinase 1
LASEVPRGVCFPVSESVPIRPRSFDRDEARICAEAIVRRLCLTWVDDDGLPRTYPFEYEKDIVQEYVRGEGRASTDRISQGCPETWPDVDLDPASYNNPLDPEEIGAFPSGNSRVVVDTRMENYGKVSALTLHEARPRAKLRFPIRGGGPTELGVGILVSGGIAPGINAVIDGIVERHTLYRNRNTFHYELNIKGYVEGFRAEPICFVAGSGILPPIV